MLEGCVRLLTVAGDAKTSHLTRKKKKAKILEGKNTEEETSVSLGSWQLRALVLSSLHKCFLYDTGSLKFLDSSNFQVNYYLRFSRVNTFNNNEQLRVTFMFYTTVLESLLNKHCVYLEQPSGNLLSVFIYA